MMAGRRGLLDPFFLSSRALRREIARAGESMRGLLVDVGCGAQPYRDCFPQAEYVGMEVLQASEHGSRKYADLYFDGLNAPLLDGCADHLLCSQVLEHVFEPDLFLAELARVLAPGGTLLLTVPFVWDEHEQPYDYARYSSFGLRHLARKHGFEAVESRRTLADAGVLAQLALAYWYKVLRPLPAAVRKPLLAAISLPTNLLGLLMSALLPGNPDLYLDNVTLWRRAAPEGGSR